VAKIDIDIDVIRHNFDTLKAKADVTVVEGAGGWYAPISKTESMADLPEALNIPAILVVGVRLGCLNHARLSKEAIEASGVEFAGWVANSIDPKLERAAENLATLEQVLGRPPLAVFPFAPGKPTAAAAMPQASTETAPTPRSSTAAVETDASQSTPAAPICCQTTAAPIPPQAAQSSTPAVSPVAHPDVHCGEHFARSLSLIS
jgi:hypothetical protein